MSEITSFQAKTRFLAREHFPYGLSRSGEFTKSQVELLEKHGQAYEALHNGVRAPINDEEKQFLEVCAGHAEPVSNHEKTWMRYCKIIQKKPHVSVFGMIAAKPSQDAEVDFAATDWSEADEDE